MLAAYALVNDLWELQLLKTDRDEVALKAAGWLTEKPSPVRGTAYYEFPAEIRDGMLAIGDAIFGSITEEELERYKARKSKAYPWLW